MGVNGEFFSFWWFLSDISATRGHIHTIFYLCTDNVCRRAPSPLGSIGPLRAGGGELKTQKMGVVSFVLRTATISIFLSASKCGSICRAQTCAQSGIEPSRSSKAFLQGGQKVRKNFKFFTMSRVYVPISQKLLTIEAYKQRTQKSFISPLSNCRMYMDQSLTGFYRVSQKVRDVIPVLRITPIATQPSAVSVFLSVAKCGAVAYVGHRPAHILA